MKTFGDWKTFLDGEGLSRADHARVLKLYKDQHTHPLPEGGFEHLERMLDAAEEDDKALVQAFIDAP